ncbi:hypothetical protein J4230_04635 [Candidatus Woesearchaeota archaeon]|nr:hypothetical protein [Candidatus Woesearchaeota archaeon]
MKKHKISKAKQRRELWSEGFFAETISQDQNPEKMRTFHMKHDEEMNFNCSKCNEKIFTHNRDWHNEMCDKCFNEEYFPKILLISELYESHLVKLNLFIQINS